MLIVIAAEQVKIEYYYLHLFLFIRIYYVTWNLIWNFEDPFALQEKENPLGFDNDAVFSMKCFPWSVVRKLLICSWKKND